MKKKPIIIAAVSAAVIVGGTTGAYFLNEHRKTGKAVAEVTPVSLMCDNYYGGDIELNGMISSGNIQNVMPDDKKLVEKILVKEGDTVKKGDSLIKYDITALELELKQKEIGVSVADNNIKTAEKELKKLKNLKSSESMPKPPEPTEPETQPTAPPPTAPPLCSMVASVADADGGTGSSGDPYIFNCPQDITVTADAIRSFRDEGTFAVFNVYDGNTIAYIRRLSGALITDEEPADTSVSRDVEYSSGGGVTVNPNPDYFGSITVPKPEPEPVEEPPAEDFSYYEDYVNDFYENLDRDYDEDYMYSRSELSKMITQKESEISRLEIEKKSAELAYKTAKEQRDSGTASARIDGVVTKVNSAENLEEGQPLLVVSSSEGLTVRGYVGEMNLDKLSIGSTVKVTFWETGAVTQAEVTEISNIPMSYESYSWNENPNSSTYEFTASITEDVETPGVDGGIMISIPTDEESKGIVIPKVYVREEEGSYYVYREGEDGLLEKKYVRTGKVIYGSQIEILSGISRDDKICFPYGKNIKSGIKTKETDEVLW